MFKNKQFTVLFNIIEKSKMKLPRKIGNSLTNSVLDKINSFFICF